MPRMDKLSSYQTTISQHTGGITVVSYRGTVIVQFTDKWVKLPTRRKMNQAARQFGLGYSVYRDKGVTRVCVNHPDGSPYLNIGPLRDPMRFDRINR